MSNCTVRVNRNTKVLEIVKSGGLPLTEDTIETFSGISRAFPPESSYSRA